MEAALRPPRVRPSLELLGGPQLDNGLLATLSLDFDLRYPRENGLAAQAIVLIASRQSYHDAISQLRSRTDAPAVVLLHEADVTDRVRALEQGADDVLVAPWDGSEVLARLRAVMRRAGYLAAETFRVEDIEINLANKSVRRGDRTIALTRTELALLIALARRAGAVVPHELLAREVWGAITSMQMIHTYVSFLRAKLDRPGEVPLVCTVRGVGYGLAL